MKSNQLFDSFCTEFMWASAYLLLLCRFWGHADRAEKTCPIQFLLSTQRIQCNKGHTRTLVCRVIYRELTWKSYTFVFGVIFFAAFFPFLHLSFNFHSNPLFGWKFPKHESGIKTIAIFGNHSNNLHEEKKRENRIPAETQFIIHLQTKSYLWILNAEFELSHFFVVGCQILCHCFSCSNRDERNFTCITI